MYTSEEFRKECEKLGKGSLVVKNTEYEWLMVDCTISYHVFEKACRAYSWPILPSASTDALSTPREAYVALCNTMTAKMERERQKAIDARDSWKARAAAALKS